MTFEEALDMIANSTNPPMPMVVLWKDIERNAYVDKTTPIELQFKGPIKIRQALEILLTRLPSEYGKMQYVVKDGLIIIASDRMKLNNKVTRVYDIREIAAGH